MTAHRPEPRTHQHGATLLEVMVALLVFSIGLLGLAALQAQGMRFNTDSYGRSQATLLAYDILDRIRLNRTAFQAGGYSVPSQTSAQGAVSTYASCKAGSCKCGTNSCTSVQLAQYDLGQWYSIQKQLLPVDTGNLPTIAKNGNQVTITMRWRDREKLRSQEWVAEIWVNAL